MERKVMYIVTSSQYDDYGIEGVFSTREKADQYVKEYNSHPRFNGRDEDDTYDKARVEEYELDEFENYILRPFWRVNLNLETNEINTVTYPYCKVLVDKNKEMEYYTDTGWNVTCDMFYVTSYVSEEHAREVCKDRLENPQRYTIEAN